MQLRTPWSKLNLILMYGTICVIWVYVLPRLYEDVEVVEINQEWSNQSLVTDVSTAAKHTTEQLMHQTLSQSLSITTNRVLWLTLNHPNRNLSCTLWRPSLRHGMLVPYATKCHQSVTLYFTIILTSWPFKKHGCTVMKGTIVQWLNWKPHCLTMISTPSLARTQEEEGCVSY